MNSIQVKQNMISVLKDEGVMIDESNFYLPLNFDSLKYMQLLIALEEKFKVPFEEIDFVEIETINDLYNLLKKKMYDAE